MRFPLSGTTPCDVLRAPRRTRCLVTVIIYSALYRLIRGGSWATLLSLLSVRVTLRVCVRARVCVCNHTCKYAVCKIYCSSFLLSLLSCRSWFSLIMWNYLQYSLKYIWCIVYSLHIVFHANACCRAPMSLFSAHLINAYQERIPCRGNSATWLWWISEDAMKSSWCSRNHPSKLPEFIM